MIGYISGTVLLSFTNGIILETNGIGWKVLTTTKTIVKNPAGSLTSLHTSHIVRENTMDLYGFESQAEVELFEKIISAPGVGPRLGLTMISNATAETVMEAITTQNPSILEKVPGIGKTKAARITLALKNKVDHIAITPSKSHQYEASSNTIVNPLENEVLHGLLNLGYSEKEAQNRISQTKNNNYQNAVEWLQACLAL